MRYNIFFFVKVLVQSAKSGQITRQGREKEAQKIVKIPVGLPVAPGITEIFNSFPHAKNSFLSKNLLKFSAEKRTEIFVIFFQSIKSDDKIIKKWPTPKPLPFRHLNPIKFQALSR